MMTDEQIKKYTTIKVVDDGSPTFRLHFEITFLGAVIKWTPSREFIEDLKAQVNKEQEELIVDMVMIKVKNFMKTDEGMIS